jgi:glycosyltransferase involved in cell wall biosynthesis
VITGASTATAVSGRDEDGRRRVPVAYLAPWVDYGGTAKGTLDWFRWIDRERYAPSLIITQAPSPNRLLPDVTACAEEVWNLPELMPGGDMPFFIGDFIHSRGVQIVHVMNSRLGFELLPDLCVLPNPPAIVVQLHVEEDTRGGYVRYVTTRYGSLVDAFSVTSRHLAATLVKDYDISPTKCHVIYSGVDGAEEFDPDHIEPIRGLEPDLLHILFLGRLVRQKDPELMVQVVDALRASDERFRVHVVGYGEMESEVREAVEARGLERLVLFHGATPCPGRWYAACDVLLLTSVYEGIPYVLYEALAMGVPAVAGALPGIAELMDERCGRLIEPRDDVDAYAGALLELGRALHLRRSLGAEGRRRMLDRFPLARMGSEHDHLYAHLLAERVGNEHRPGMVV